MNDPYPISLLFVSHQSWNSKILNTLYNLKTYFEPSINVFNYFR